MKSRTLIDVDQSPGRKPLQGLPSLDSFSRVALPFMTLSGRRFGLLAIGCGAPPSTLIYVKPASRVLVGVQLCAARERAESNQCQTAVLTAGGVVFERRLVRWSRPLRGMFADAPLDLDQDLRSAATAIVGGW